MLFSSYIFLFLFLPIVLAIYYIVPVKLKNFFLLIASLFFYAWGVPTLILVLVLSSIADYYLSNFYSKNENENLRKPVFIISILLNVSLLIYFKYSNFFVLQANYILEFLGLTSIIWKEVALPIGISFFTFQKISYLVDVYFRKVKPADNLIDYLLFVALFPQLIAGPIIKYHDINNQLKFRNHSIEIFFSGFVRFCVGLGKKVLIADAMGAVADNVFGLEYSQLTTPYSWIGILCYSMQIYFDFSGYSDMAIGLGKMFGFTFEENFNYPYIAKNITEFWRRWHISLSTWMKEYLYIPLGGNQCGLARNYINLWTVFLISGLWHGASWNFILWGAYHGLFLSLDKLFFLRMSKKLPNFIKMLYTFFLVVNGWVLFRAENLSAALSFYKKMYALTPEIMVNNYTYFDQVINNRGCSIITILIIMILFSDNKKYQKIRNFFESSPSIYNTIIKGSCAIALYILSVLTLSATTYNPFIYFKF